MKTQHETDIDELVKWLRGIEFHDEDEDGIGEQVERNGTLALRFLRAETEHPLLIELLADGLEDSHRPAPS